MDAPFGWPGGKRSLIKTLLPLIPQHRAYVEVFSGSAKLLFSKPPSEWEVLNDINGDVVNFFRVAKHRPSALAELLERDLVASQRFRDLLRQSGCPAIRDTEGEIERALRFGYLTWNSFGCMGRTFASSTVQHLGSKHALRRSLASVSALLDQTSARLANVLVEDRDFAECIRRNDCPETFFYLDPPYTNFAPNSRYKPLGDRVPELFNLLAHIQGKFLMSFDDAAIIRKLARLNKMTVRTVSTSYSLARGTHQKKRELLIANYSLRLR
ncbi:MAG TPA: DNA adenine methylase [Candidatus Angelobacter sp.]|nr:DNA adenine methylase [Candidatus Angelobacter sp.]